MGRWRLHGIPRSGTVAVRREGLCPRTRRNADKLGRPCEPGHALLPEYEPSVGAFAEALKSYWGKEVSDPVNVAQVVLRLAGSDSLPAHLLIGSDAVRFAGEAERTREAEAKQWRQMSLSTDVDSSTVLPDM